MNTKSVLVGLGVLTVGTFNVIEVLLLVSSSKTHLNKEKSKDSHLNNWSEYSN